MSTTRHLGASLAALHLVCGGLAAQGERFERLDLRVSAPRPNGQCVIDRGKREKVEVGDRVVLSPRGGQPLTGRVLQVEDRTALVQLLDPKASVARGTRGHVLIPRTRKQQAGPDPADPAVEPQPPTGEPGAQDPPGDEVWRPGMPLLGRHRAPRPNERDAQLRGRLYGSSNLVRTLDSFSQSYARAGADVDVNNIDGDGGRLRFHGEFVHSEEVSGNTGSDLRIYELSYAHGGTRFDPWRWQVGRFLQQDMPEFGLLDGIEVGFRSEHGDRFGASVGYLPELDDDLDSLADLQLAAWYVFNPDVSERISYAIGYQKTWHRWDADRDLIVAKARYLPHSGWDVSSAIWVDIYDNDDNLKDEAFEFTRANLFATRRWQDEGGVELFYDHEEYPELLRNETPQTLLPQTLIGAHVDRVSAHLWTGGGDRAQWFTRTTGWVDEEDEGFAFELGGRQDDVLGSRTRSGLALFHVNAQTSNVTGVRIEHGGDYQFGRLDLLYELGFVHFDDQPSDRSELLQHRFAALVSTGMGSGWDATFTGDVTVWDEEISFGVGIYLQKLF
ncbi:MAG: hypothetical protein ACE37K_20010 [Planctomycetota bacterium]